MKRLSEKALNRGDVVVYTHSDRVFGTSPKVMKKDGIVRGYVVLDTFLKLLKNGTLVKTFGDFWYAEYTIGGKQE